MQSERCRPVGFDSPLRVGRGPPCSSPTIHTIRPCRLAFWAVPPARHLGGMESMRLRLIASHEAPHRLRLMDGFVRAASCGSWTAPRLRSHPPRLQDIGLTDVLTELASFARFLLVTQARGCHSGRIGFVCSFRVGPLSLSVCHSGRIGFVCFVIADLLKPIPGRSGPHILSRLTLGLFCRFCVSRHQPSKSTQSI
jgi:hypothetical protein